MLSFYVSILDVLPDDLCIDNTELLEQNLENVTAQEVLEETILSPAKNMLGGVQELNNFFPEEFINLAALESNMTSFSTGPSNIAAMPQDFCELFANAKEDVCQNACQIENAALDGFNLETAPQDNIIESEPTTECEAIAVVPNLVSKSPMSVPPSPINSSDFAVLSESLSIDIDQLDELLENLEKSNKGNMEPTCTKQALKRSATSKARVCKKMKSQACRSTDDEQLFDKVVERRIKNNAASRVCRASRKARHQDLFRQEKELLSENKKLYIQVAELLAKVDYLKSCLVKRLSGQHN